MAKLLAKKHKNPKELVDKLHQAFVRIPYESNKERCQEEAGKLLQGLKVSKVADYCCNFTGLARPSLNQSRRPHSHRPSLPRNACLEKA
jgi:hypothetical protein